MDDVAGLFDDPSAMAILKASTWPSRDGRRIVKWGSTSSKAVAQEFEFTWDLIIVCNGFPNTIDGEAIRSRGFSRRIDVSLSEAKALLVQAAKDPRWFHDTALAERVAALLIQNLSESTLPQISFRTLKKGYRLAESHPDDWETLFLDTLPSASVDPMSLLQDLAGQDLKVKDQARIFYEKTGLKKRSFYNYRKELSLSKKDRSAAR